MTHILLIVLGAYFALSILFFILFTIIEVYLYPCFLSNLFIMFKNKEQPNGQRFVKLFWLSVFWPVCLYLVIFFSLTNVGMKIIGKINIYLSSIGEVFIGKIDKRDNKTNKAEFSKKKN